MSDKIKNYIGVAAVAGIVLSVVAVFWFASSYSESVGPQASFSVSAEGEVVAVPDVAEFSATVITEGGEDLGVLQEENTTKVNGLIDYIKDQGVEDEDITTASYNISPRYQNFRCPEEGGVCPPPEIVGYTVRQNIDIKVRDFSNIGDLLSGVVNEGANSVSSLRFTIDDPTEVREEARIQAIEKAKEKARSMADQAGFSIGDLVSINESYNQPYQPIYYEESLARGGASADAAIPSPDIEPGSQDVTVHVSLTYEIK